jgi:hypothetical protein
MKKCSKVWRHSNLLTALLILAVSAEAQAIHRRPTRLSGFTPARPAVEAGSPAAGSTWTLLFPTHLLDERFAGAAVYDAATNSLIVFGGLGAGAIAIDNDVIALANANGIGTSNWTTVIPNGAPGSPAARDSHTAVYDAANSRMIVFGGCSFTGGLCTTLLNDVWVLTNANGVSGKPTWMQLAPTGPLPSPRWSHAAAYDPSNNRMIIFGGEDQHGVVSDTWLLSNANGSGGTPIWTQLSPSGGPPTGQDSPSVVYDEAHNVLIEFAGVRQNFGPRTNSVWTLSKANGLGGNPVWTNIVANGAAGSPPKRDGHFAAYDAANNRMMIFGGNANTATGFPQLNDAWVLRNANGLVGKPRWSRVKPAGAKPGGRTSHVGGYDSANNRMIIYGGSSWDGNFFSTWVLTGANGLP